MKSETTSRTKKLLITVLAVVTLLLCISVSVHAATAPSDPSTDVIYLSGKYGSEPMFDVSMSFVDVNKGATYRLKCLIGSNEYTVATSAATGSTQTLTGTVDLSGLADGTYKASFRILNSNGTLSTAVDRDIVIENGHIADGLDEACAVVEITKDYERWDIATDNVMIGTSLESAVPNGSCLKNGTYNIYVMNHASGTVTLEGGYTEISTGFLPIYIDEFDEVVTDVYQGTASADVELPETISLISEEGITYAVRINWEHYLESYDNEGYEIIYGNIKEIVGYEQMGMHSEMFILPYGITARINVLHVHSHEEVRIAPTCTRSGVLKDVCTCGDEINAVTIPAVGHDLGEWIVDSVATCTTSGLKHAFCSVCEDGVAYETTPAFGHQYRETERVPESCAENGYVRYVCERSECGDTKTVTLLAHGHSLDLDNECTECGFKVTPHAHRYTTYDIDPTCTSMGYSHYVCDCGYSRNAFFIEPLAHDFIEHIETEKTCFKDGKTVYTCKNDGCDARLELIDPAAHSYEEWISHYPTCTEAGLKIITCTECGEFEDVVMPPKHEWDSINISVIKEVSCTEAGIAKQHCQNCSAQESFEIEFPGHQFVEGVCTVCDARIPDIVTPSAGSELYGMFFKIDDIISKYGPDHINEYGVMLDYNKDANIKRVAVYLTQEGRMWRRCIAVVGEGITYATYVPYLSYGENVIYSGLNSTQINSFSLKENSDGIWCLSDYATIGVNLEDYKGDLLLSLYNIGQTGAQTKIFDDLEEMKAWLKFGEAEEGHTHEMGEWFEALAATCEKSGQEKSECSGCGYYETRLIDKLGHEMAAVDAKAPDCSNTGWNDHEACTRCNYSENRTELEKLGHDIQNHAAKTPSYTEAGCEAYETCKNCEYTTYKEIPALGLSAKFEDEVDTALGTMEERYDAIINAARTYAALSDEEKARVNEAYLELERLAEEYNGSARDLTAEHYAAREKTVSAVLDHIKQIHAAYIEPKTKEEIEG